LFIIMSFIYVSNRAIPGLFQLTPQQAVWLNALFHSIFCLTAIFGLLSFFQQYLDRTTRIWGALAATSYPIYFLHQFFVQEAAWLIRPLEANAYVKYLLTCALALAISFLLSKYLLLHLPCFAGKKKQ
jgi:peptidoglycan/LPS O-acetylase OafA/YrhL